MNLASVIFKVVLLFVSRWLEIDKEKRAERKELTKEVKSAFKVKDKKARASRINSIVNKSNRL